ncbi:hypothetical protein DA83_21265 [Pseudomonas sp. 250J]|nr:hypothetical protein DA83_21265 [Pseudomonas sp. 250J]
MLAVAICAEAEADRLCGIESLQAFKQVRAGHLQLPQGGRRSLDLYLQTSARRVHAYFDMAQLR